MGANKKHHGNSTKRRTKRNAELSENSVSEPEPKSRSIVNYGIAMAVAVIGIGILAFVYFQPDPNEREPLTIQEAANELEKARLWLQDGEYKKAEDIATDVLYRSELQDEALIIAGEAATRQDKLDDALAYYVRVKPEEDDEHLLSLWGIGEIQYATGKLSNSEACFREILRIDPESLDAKLSLAKVLDTTGRRWEARRYHFELVKEGLFDLDHLILMNEMSVGDTRKAFLEMALERVPGDAISHIGLARAAIDSMEFSQALQHTSKVLERDASQLDVMLIAGRIYLDEGFPNGFDQWRRSLPETALEHPETWYIFGSHNESLDRNPEAIRCYWECLKLDADHAPSVYRLSRLLQTNGEAEEAAAYIERAELIAQYDGVTIKLSTNRADETAIGEIATLTDAMGRYWEAFAWYTIATEIQPDNIEFERRKLAIGAELDIDTPRVIDEANLAIRFDLSRFPEPAWARMGDVAVIDINLQNSADTLDDTTLPQFVDIAKSAGIDFQYVNGDSLDEPGMQIYQELGGAIVVCDFDQDGWPDIYLSQGGAMPMTAGKDAPRDRMYRNLGTGSFIDVTDEANLGDQLYSQGASAGDINNDGFPDLLLCNIDENRVYLNLGDGTFQDITTESGLVGRRWSTSCAIADLNQDGLSDFYVCNYAAGDEPYQLRCEDNGVPRACQPNQFEAAQDRVYFNQGDGTFVDATQTAGFTGQNGRALGVVIGDLSRNGTMGVFVANDTTENFYYTSQGSSGSTFTNEALIRGLAGDFRGSTQACMGIAADDANGDGLIDLHVTNFYNEANTLYQQLEAGLFEDTSRSQGLRQASIGILGFGTQFIDPELDGWPDLIVANGHVDDYTHVGNGFRMRPQFFRNQGAGSFNEIPQHQLPSYFQDEYLGRSMALVDFDRDGRQDFGVMHLDCPFSLLQNETKAVGKFVHLHFVATESARDAFGAVVEIKTADRTFTKHLVAGSGYQASNERSLLVGLGNVEEIEELVVYWPSGNVQSHVRPPLGADIKLVEGSQELVIIPR